MTLAQSEQQLFDIESAIAQCEQVQIEVKHKFAPGLYIRECHVPAGALIAGARHKTSHAFTLAKGVLYIIENDGSRKVVEAPFTGVTEVGTKRCAFAEEDSVFITYHPTDKTDIEEISDDLIEPEGHLLPQWKEANKCLLSQ